MKFAKAILSCAVLVSACTVGTAAKAHDGLGGLGLSYLYGYNGFNVQGRCNNFRQPYFSLHPPVYYGKRYSRPYGVSPFAAWPQLSANPNYAPSLQPTRSLTAPAIVVNPYAPLTSASERPSITQANPAQIKPVAPLVIENPYFRGDVQYTTKSVD